MALVVLNVFKILPFGDTGTLVGIVLSMVATLISITKFQFTIVKYRANKAQIDILCDDAADRALPPFISKEFDRKPKDLIKFKVSLKKELSNKFIHTFILDDIKREISRRYVVFFKTLIGKKFPKESIEIYDFIYYLIYRSFSYPHLAHNIYSSYENGFKKNLFNLLYKAYYQRELKVDFDALCEKANEMSKIKSESISNIGSDIIKEIPEPNRKNLESYLVNMLMKNLAVASLEKSLKDIQLINQFFLIILGEKEKNQEQLIFKKIEKAGGHLIIKTSFETVFFYRSQKNYNKIDEFLKNEILVNIPNNHRYIVMATRVFPTEVGFIHHGNVRKHYEKIEISASKIRIDVKRIKDLLTIIGKPIIELVEDATIDFFTLEDINISDNERFKLASKSELIYTTIREMKNLIGDGATKVLSEIEIDELAMVVQEQCGLSEYRANEIAKSIKENIATWRNSIYQEEEGGL